MMNRSLLFSALLACLLSLVSALNIIEATSLNSCQEDSQFTASMFHAVFTPHNGSVTIKMEAITTITGNVIAEVKLIVYGKDAITERIDPCKLKELEGFCPMRVGHINRPFNLQVGQDVVGVIPGVAYTVPDIDGKVQLHIRSATTGESLACVEAELSNQKSVYHKAVSWVTAAIAAIGLLASAICSRLSHANAAAHIAANALALFFYFQAQAIIGMSSVTLPPIASSWTQNFQWSMGVIRLTFIQQLCTWYQRATGGQPTLYIPNLAATSVSLQKRATADEDTAGTIILRGIERVGFRARIESTNIFLTSYCFFVIFMVLLLVLYTATRFIYQRFVQPRQPKKDLFQDLDWSNTLKGLVSRVLLFALAPMSLLCLWQLTVRNSPAEVVLAVFTILSVLLLLAWGYFKVHQLARASTKAHGSPAHDLFGNSAALERWGTLYIQFKASSYYFGAISACYVFVKCLFIGVTQQHPKVQAVALIVIEAAFLVSVSVLRPYLDKRSNILSITIAAINFLSSVFLLIFSNVFEAPGLVIGVSGVVFFVVNIIATFIVILIVLGSSTMALLSKNPEVRYQVMLDDRGSFIKSQVSLAGDLDRLAAVARGDKAMQSQTSFSHRNSVYESDLNVGPLPSNNSRDSSFNQSNPKIQ